MLDMIEAVPSRELSPAESATAARNREYLAFRLGHEEYGIDILKVQEIRSCDAITGIAGVPAHVKGVIDLRGIIVPIIDMRIRFNLEQANYDAFTVVIILNVGKRVVGIVVDAVSDVMSLTADQVRPPPEFGDRFDTEYVVGIGAVDDRMLILVDIEKLIGGADMPL